MTDLGGIPRSAPEPYDWRSTRADGTVTCRECGNSDWVEVNSRLTGTPTVRPCSRCRPETYRRWAEGFPSQKGDRHGPAYQPEPRRPEVVLPPVQEAF